MNVKYMPEQGSLPHRVLSWFDINREEELTLADIARKFDVAVVGNVRPSLALAIQHQLLSLGKDEKGQAVVSIGPSFDAWKAGAGRDAVVHVRPYGGIKRSAPPPLLDLDAVDIKQGVISPGGGKNAPTLRKQMFTLLDRLQPNTRIELPLAYQHSLKNAVTAYGKEHPEKKFGITTNHQAAQVIVNRFA